ncbi:MAG: heat-inducible transcriptional repressor HrcA [Candidatus Hydrogenedentota bacterium]
MHKLSEREELVLHAVVHAYITTAEPVGSRALVKRVGLDISPATVRNVMSDLEEMGFLAQLHTSSGRVPTDQGYRYYVDYLMRVQELTRSERARIEGELTIRLNDAESVLRQTSHLLALISHQAGIVQGPDTAEATVSRIDIMPLKGERAVVIMVDSFGRVRTSVLSIAGEMTQDEAAKLNAFLNEHLQNAPLSDIAGAMHRKLESFVDEQRRIAARVIEVLELVPPAAPGQLFMDGATHLFEQPEFKDMDKAREVFGLLEENDRVLALLRAGVTLSNSDNASIVIGSEATGSGVREISVVSAPYSIGGQSVGRIGVLGPRRMPYSKLAGVVGATASVLSRFLTRLAG